MKLSEGQALDWHRRGVRKAAAEELYFLRGEVGRDRSRRLRCVSVGQQGSGSTTIDFGCAVHLSLFVCPSEEVGRAGRSSLELSGQLLTPRRIYETKYLRDRTAVCRDAVPLRLHWA